MPELSALFRVVALANAILAFLFGATVFVGVNQQRRTKAHLSFLFLTTSVGIWSLAYYFWLGARSGEEARVFLGLLNMGAAFIPSTFFHWVRDIFSLSFRHVRWWLMGGYGFALVFVLLGFTPHFVKDFHTLGGFSYWPTAGDLYWTFILYYCVYLGLSIYFIGKLILTSASSRQTQRVALVISGALVITVIIGISNFLPWYKVTIWPWGSFLVPIAIFLFLYAMAQFNLMQMRTSLAQMLVLLMVGLAFTDIFSADRWTEFTTRTLLFLLVLSFAFLFLEIYRRDLKRQIQLQKLTKDLQAANKRLQELDKQKTEFLSIASHQLRGPVAVVRGYSSLLREGSYGKLPPSAQEIIDRIEASSAAMAQMVDDFLNVTRIEQGRMQYDMHHFDLGQLVSLVCEEFSMRAKEKGLSFSCAIARQPAQYPYYGDQVKIRQVLANLIDNAIKYTPSGWVRVSLSRGRGAKQEYVVTVEDSGIGIPPEEIPTLFSKFHRASNVQGANVSGTGLGLYIAKRLVEAHSGSIRIFSEGRGKGSRFVITLPAFPTRISHNENATINN